MKNYNIVKKNKTEYFIAESEDGFTGEFSLLEMDVVLSVLQKQNSKYYKRFSKFIFDLTRKCAYAIRTDDKSQKLSKFYDLRARGLVFKLGWYKNFPIILNELSKYSELYYPYVHLNSYYSEIITKNVENVLSNYQTVKVLKK